MTYEEKVMSRINIPNVRKRLAPFYDVLVKSPHDKNVKLLSRHKSRDEAESACPPGAFIVLKACDYEDWRFMDMYMRDKKTKEHPPGTKEIFNIITPIFLAP